MADTGLQKRLGMKTGQRVLLLNAPEGYLERLQPAPGDVPIDLAPTGSYELGRYDLGSYELVHLFAKDKAELERLAPSALQALKPGAILWIGYPKKSSGIDTDLSRDEGWAVIYSAGLTAVSLISIDETWSAVRFKPGASEQEAFDRQYTGPKAALRPIYDRLAAEAQALGSDVTIGVRESYVALGRKKQFAVIAASTKERVDLGVRLPGVAPAGRLQAAGSFGSGQITHRVALTSVEQVDEEVLGWLRAAYAAAG